MLQLATPAEREAVERLARQAHEFHVSWRPDLYEMPGELYSEERYTEAIRSRSLYVEKLDDTVIGYCLIPIKTVSGPGLLTRKVMRITEFCVEESLRNQGFGKDMMASIRALARAFRCTDLELGVYPQNDDAVGFWQKCGFTIRSIEMQQKV